MKFHHCAPNSDVSLVLVLFLLLFFFPLAAQPTGRPRGTAGPDRAPLHQVHQAQRGEGPGGVDQPARNRATAVLGRAGGERPAVGS